MATFCDKCGAEIKDDTVKFCHKCGAEISVKQISVADETIGTGICCPHCGNLVPIGQKVCMNCGQPLEDNKIAIILGYIFAILGSLFGAIINLGESSGLQDSIIISHGYAGAINILGSLFGTIIGIYLLTRNSEKSKYPKTHGAIILVLSIIGSSIIVGILGL